MEKIYQEPDRKKWLEAELKRCEYTRQRFQDAKEWLMIPKVEADEEEIYLDEILCEEDINAIRELIDSLIEKEIYRFEGALWRMEREEQSMRTM